MMNTLTAAELKRRGMAAIEAGLRHGPIQLVKHNRPAGVVLPQDQYQRLIEAQPGQVPGMTALQWLLTHVPQRGLSKQEIDRRMDRERSW